MATNIITTIFSKPSLSIMNMATGEVVAKNLKVVKGSFRMSAETMRHQMEDGTTEVDTRVIKAATAIFDVICPDLNTLAQVNSVMLDLSSIFQVTSRGLIFQSLRVDAQGIKQTSEMLSATPVRLSFKQALIENKDPVIFVNSADSSLIDRGIAMLDNAKETVADLYNKTSSSITTFLS